MLLALAHLLIAAIWLGSMAYSLLVVQPAVARHVPDDEEREGFLLALAHGNRWKVVAMVGALVLTALGTMIIAPGVVAGYTVALVLYLAAAAVFVHVSWRHWPARVFALPEELGGFQRRLRAQAWVIFALVAVAFIIVLGVSVDPR